MSNQEEYAEKIADLMVEIHTFFERENLSNGEIVDLIAALLIGEIFKAREMHGRDGMTGVLERFMRRLSVMPGFEAKIIETRGKE